MHDRIRERLSNDDEEQIFNWHTEYGHSLSSRVVSMVPNGQFIFPLVRLSLRLRYCTRAVIAMSARRVTTIFDWCLERHAVLICASDRALTALILRTRDKEEIIQPTLQASG